MVYRSPKWFDGWLQIRESDSEMAWFDYREQAEELHGWKLIFRTSCGKPNWDFIHFIHFSCVFQLNSGNGSSKIFRPHSQVWGLGWSFLPWDFVPLWRRHPQVFLSMISAWSNSIPMKSLCFMVTYPKSIHRWNQLVANRRGESQPMAKCFSNLIFQ